MDTHLRLGHVALPAAEPHALSGFYIDRLGLRYVEKPTARHLAFRVESLEDLRHLHARCVAADGPPGGRIDRRRSPSTSRSRRR